MEDWRRPKPLGGLEFAHLDMHYFIDLEIDTGVADLLGAVFLRLGRNPKRYALQDRAQISIRPRRTMNSGRFLGHIRAEE